MQSYDEKRKINNQIEQAQLRIAQPGYGIVMEFDEEENTATVLLAYPGSDMPGEFYTNVPCPTHLGIQTVAPEVGRPCFPAGTLVLTREGSKNIEDVLVGDYVLTHKKRWRRVNWSGLTGYSETVEIRGHGGIVKSTPDHQFFTKEVFHEYAPNKNNPIKKVGGEEWIQAERLLGKYWAIPAAFPSESPILPEGFAEESLPENFWWVIGRWLGDGWTAHTGPQGKRGSGTSRVTICCGKHEVEILEKELSDPFWVWGKNQDTTSFKFSFYNENLRRWLRSEFGAGASNKEIPTWLLGCNDQIKSDFLDGYISADGCKMISDKRREYTSITTVSKKLAVGIKMLSASLHNAPTIQTWSPNKNSTTIEDRLVNCQDSFKVTWAKAKLGEAYCQALLDDGHMLGRVKKINLDTEIVPVFDIEVEEDHSFVADGVIVHNCWVAFKDGIQSSPVITHFFHHSHKEMEYDKQYTAENNVPRFMMEL